MVTTYWGFYIPADTTLALVDRLVIDPVFLYLVMILLVPMSFGFTYMMIKLAKEAERKAKIAKEKGPKQVSTIRLSQQWINWLVVALLAFQVFLNIAAYNAALTGMKNIELFLVGMIMITFAGFFHLYRYSMNESKKAPPPPPPKPDVPQLAAAEKVPEVESEKAVPEKPPLTK